MKSCMIKRSWRHIWEVELKMLTLKDVDAGYGSFQILFGISLEIPDKQLAAIIGPNGSGKSTLLKAVVGIARVIRGEINLDGGEISGLPPHIIVNRGAVYIPQTDNVFPMLSAKENIRIAGHGSLLDLQTRVERAIEIFPMIEPWLNRKAYTLSGGERQILALTMALQKQPKMILFDEPTAHLAPRVAEQILRKIVELRDRFNITVIVVEQNVRKVLEISDYAYVLAAGRVVTQGASSTILSNPELGKIFLSADAPTRSSANA